MILLSLFNLINVKLNKLNTNSMLIYLNLICYIRYYMIFLSLIIILLLLVQLEWNLRPFLASIVYYCMQCKLLYKHNSI